MLEKIGIISPTEGNFDLSFAEAVFPTSGLVKTAEARRSLFDPRLQDFVSRLSPDARLLYVLVNALGALEYWGQNINADRVREVVLRNEDPDDGYRSFLKAGTHRNHCFPAGTTVLRADRQRVPIETIHEGELVLTSAGTGRVTRTYQRHYRGPAVALTLQGQLDELVATIDHPLLILRRDQVHCRHHNSRLTPEVPHQAHCKEFREPMGDPLEVQAAQVLPGDYLLLPTPAHGREEVSEPFARLVGWVAADGYLNRRGVSFTFSSSNTFKISSVVACLEANGLTPYVRPRHDGLTEVTASSVGVHDRLSQYITGVKATKRLRGRILTWSREPLLQMLGAYIDGDGYVPEVGKTRGQLRIRSSSRQMLFMLGDVIRALGTPCTMNWDSEPREFASPMEGYGNYWSSDSGCVAVAAAYSERVTCYSQRCGYNRAGRRAQELQYQNFHLVRVLDVQELDLDEEVYNLETEPDHTYVAGEIVVHNCNGPGNSFGQVVLSVYNPRMHRVELVLAIDRALAAAKGHQDLIGQLDAGKHIPVSMGLRTAYDICSWCGHLSRTTKDYCFPEGTEVSMANGALRPIEEIREGDFVLDAEGVPTKVVALMSRHTCGDLVGIRHSLNGEVLWATSNHPVLTKTFPVPEYRPMEDLRVGDSVFALAVLGSGSSLDIGHVLESTRRAFSGVVYNFETKAHSYVAGGIAVHNCDCLRYHKNEIRADGVQCGMDNPQARFFDISFVLIGADRTSFVVGRIADGGKILPEILAALQSTGGAQKVAGLAKTASTEYGPLVDPAQEAERKGTKPKIAAHKLAANKLAAKKLAEIIKHIPAMSQIRRKEPLLPRWLLDKLGSLPLPSALATPTAAGILLRPPEFQRVVLISIGRRDLADTYEGTCPCQCHKVDKANPFFTSDVNSEVLESLIPLMDQRSMFGPVLRRRIYTAKDIPTRPIIDRMREARDDDVSRRISAAYNGYQQRFALGLPEFAQNVALQNPGILSRIVPDAVEAAFAGVGLPKTAGPVEKLFVLGVLPATYFLSQALESLRVDPDKESKGIWKFMKDHPVVAGSVLAGLLRMATK